MAVATTPCPHCQALVPVPAGDEGTCPACQAALRFIDVPDVPCASCQAPIPIDGELLTCACGHRQPADPRRRVQYVAACPRCRRRIEVGTGDSAACPHCGQVMTLQDTL